MIAGLEKRYDRRSDELDLAYAESILDEAKDALESNQRVTVTVAPVEYKSKYLSHEDPAAVSMRWIGPKTPATLRVDPLALRLLDRDVLRLGMVQQLARMPYERSFNALVAPLGPLCSATILALWWFVGFTAGLAFIVAVGLAVFPVAAALLRWEIYQADKKALQVCNGDVESFKELLLFNNWNDVDALRRGKVRPSRLPWWLDDQPRSAARLNRFA